MQIMVLGTGYVGLVSAACLASWGHKVTCYDIDSKKIQLLQEGNDPIFEPGLKPLIDHGLASDRLSFVSRLNFNEGRPELIFLTVGTPTKEDLSVDCSALYELARYLGENLHYSPTLIIKSTVPIGTSQRLYKIIKEHFKSRGLTNFPKVISNPEFMSQGSAVADFLRPDRIVIGAQVASDAEKLVQLYQAHVPPSTQLLVMKNAEAEVIKYGANAMLASRISLVNELSRIAASLKIDMEKVKLGIGTDRRIGSAYLSPGIGFGGSCLGKDVAALLGIARHRNLNTPLLAAINETNQLQRQFFLNNILAYYHNTLECVILATWGLSFKANTCDTRNSPAVAIINGLLQHGAIVRAYDPSQGHGSCSQMNFGDSFSLCSDALDAINGADGLVILTDWSEFFNADFAKIKCQMRRPVIFDGRNQLDSQKLRQYGLDYMGLGLPGLEN